MHTGCILLAAKCQSTGGAELRQMLTTLQQEGMHPVHWQYCLLECALLQTSLLQLLLSNSKLLDQHNLPLRSCLHIQGVKVSQTANCQATVHF